MIFVGALAVPTQAARQVQVVAHAAVDSGFVEQRLTWLGYVRPGFVLRWRTYVSDGMVLVCGAVAYGAGVTQSESAEVLRRAYITHDGHRILRDLTFFAEVSHIDRLAGARSNCASSGVTAPNGPYSMRLGWDRGIVAGRAERR